MSQITLKQIAERAGTSVGTVDRALNNRGRISPSTKEKIIKIADEMGYQPNKIASALSRSKRLRIAVIYAKYPAYFVDEFTAGLKKAIEHFTHYKIEIITYRCNALDPQSQIEVIKDIDFSNIDGFSLNASGQELAPYINRISDMGIPVVTFNSDIPGTKRLFHVGMDPFMAGRVSFNLMAKMLQGKGKILAMPGFHSVLSHEERIKGFLETARDYPNIQVIPGGEYKDREDLAIDLVQKALAEHQDIAGIYTVSSPGVIGAGKYLSQLPKESRPIAVGYDTSQDMKQLMEKDACTFVIYQNPAAQIYYSIVYLVEYVLFGTLPSQELNFLPPQIVVRENIDYYLEGDNKFVFVN